MFSMTTIASSTTRPVASVSPKSVSVLIEKSNSFTNAKVPMSETGSVSAVMSTLRQPCRNRKITRITRAIASASVVITSSIDARTASVVSVAGPVLEARREVPSPGDPSRRKRASRTSSALAVGSWKMPMPTRGLAAEAQELAVVLGAELGCGHVADAHDLAVGAALNHDVVELLGLDRVVRGRARRSDTVCPGATAAGRPGRPRPEGSAPAARASRPARSACGARARSDRARAASRTFARRRCAPRRRRGCASAGP